jgi:hypothetical protein
VDSKRQEPNAHDNDSGRSYRVRLPGFVKDHEIGLGDMIKHVSSTIGIKPCAGCEKRAQSLNHWMVFTR